ncbi:MAG: SDR family oxidoreductase [Bacteroidia bacterium]|nr:SDR family oxidoreductase [Bacteroidia bacterium]
MQLDLSKKTALVGGSTDGIGKSCAFLLAQTGANVILLARNKDKAEETKRQLPCNYFQQHQIIIADQAIRSDLEKLDLPEVDILVNNTGGPASGIITDASPDAFLAAFQQHLIANHVLTQKVVPGMKARKFGRIINIISTSVKQPIKGLGVSNTIRAAVANWAKTLANELGEWNITVNNVLPGATETGRLQSLLEAKANKTGNPLDGIIEEMIQEIPMKRFAKPEEIAAVVVFLASDWASYVNGINVPVDGGRTGCL